MTPLKTLYKNSFSCNNVAISFQWPRHGWISKHLVFQVDALLADGAELTALGHEHDQEGDGAAAQEPEAWDLDGDSFQWVILVVLQTFGGIASIQDSKELDNKHFWLFAPITCG